MNESCGTELVRALFFNEANITQDKDLAKYSTFCLAADRMLKIWLKSKNIHIGRVYSTKSVNI